MMSVLLWLRRVYRDARVDMWMIGLTFILIEAIAVAVFRSKEFVQATHVIALDAYVLAGVSFGWAARKDTFSAGGWAPLPILPAVPLFAVASIYGLDVKARQPFMWIAVASLVGGFAYLLLPGRQRVAFRVLLALIHTLTWAPMVYFAWTVQLRWMVYWGLTCLYLLVALSFRGLVRKDRIGGAVIVAGFVFWAMCFFFHPMVRGHAPFDGIEDQVWNMQKFFVILGMLLVLLEEQTRRRQDEAMHDPLTGLPNRRLFDDRLAQALERSRRTGMSTALFVLDLNGFKQINDNHGHVTGDQVLMRVADALRQKVRASDTLARCGGDEFSVIVTDLSRREDCDRIAAALEGAIQSVDLPGDAEKMSASVGYALFPQDAVSMVTLRQTADLKMYGNKESRRVPVPV
jgi:diguanylate cyclase (GGDEF)-like protein